MAPRALIGTIVVALFTAALIPETQAGDGIVTANAYRPFKDEKPISVKAWDNSDQDIAVARAIRDQLKAIGYVVSDQEDISLSFEIKTLKGSWTDGQRRHFLELEGHGGRQGGENASVRLNLYSSESGGVLNTARPGQPNTASRYLLEFMLDPKQGPRLWEGQVAVEYTGGDPAVLLRRMVPELLPHLGETVRGRRISLP